MSRMSGHDSVNRNVSSRVRKVVSDGADVTSSCSICGHQDMSYKLTSYMTWCAKIIIRFIANFCQQFLSNVF